MMRAFRFVGRVALLVWFVGLGITFVVMVANRKPLEAASEVPAVQAAIRPASPDVGSECVIAGPTYLGRTYEDFEEAHRFSMAKDGVGLGTLIIQQRIEDLEPGTRVLVIEEHFTTYRIRVLEGRQVGKDGYVYREALKLP